MTATIDQGAADNDVVGLSKSRYEEDTVTAAQPEHHSPDPRVRPIPHTIDAVSNALGATKRMAFYAEIGQAGEGEHINAVLRKWWMEAMFDSRPGREQRLADAGTRRGLTPLPRLVGGEE
nr:hypothetical protein OH820_20425 [Streptomyces sp. NBC_00857]